MNPKKIYEKMKKEKVNCNICGSEDLVQVADVDRYNMGIKTVICRKCGFMFTNPRPTEKEMNKFYKKIYRRFYIGGNNPDLEYKDKLYRTKIKWLYNFVLLELRKRKIKNPSVLEVGCGCGFLLKIFRSNFPKSNLQGIEPSVKFAKYAEKKSKAVVFKQDINLFFKSEHLKGTYDLIILNQVLEHLYNPADKLLELRKFLKKDGLLFVQVPNATSPNWEFSLKKFHIAHVNHFTPESLKNLFDVSGFKIVKKFCRKHPVNPWSISFLCQKKDKIKTKIPRISSKKFNFLFFNVKNKLKSEKDLLNPYLVKKEIKMCFGLRFICFVSSLSENYKNKGIRRGSTKNYEDF